MSALKSIYTYYSGGDTEMDKELHLTENPKILWVKDFEFDIDRSDLAAPNTEINEYLRNVLQPNVTQSRNIEGISIGSHSLKIKMFFEISEMKFK